MKTKLTKIWGVGLTLVLLAMLVGAALPASPASAATLEWSTVVTPNPLDNNLTTGTDVELLAIAPDGSTMFAYDNANDNLYKSLDGGETWIAEPGIGIDLPNVDMVALAVSSDYANDSTVVIAAANAVYRSVNGGKNWGEVGDIDTATNWGATEEILSVDVSPYYLGGSAILVGSEDTTGGDVWLFTTSSLLWVDQSIGAEDALAVAFSPNHPADAQILAVTTDGTDTYVRTKIGTGAWDANVEKATITGLGPTSAVIAFPDDYEWSANANVLIGTDGDASGTTDEDDVYRVLLAVTGGTSRTYDLDVGGLSSATRVHSIAVKGATAEADVLVGQKDSTTVMRAHDPTTSTVTWRGSTKSPTGDGTAPNVTVVWSPTAATVYAATDGEASAVSWSADGGVTFNQVSLIDITDIAELELLDLAVVDTSTMFLLIYDDDDGSGTINAGDYSSVWKTTNGGFLWERIWTRETTGTERMEFITLSPNYADDETLFVAENGTRLWRSTNGGETFIGLTAPAAITALGVVDKDTYYTGYAGGVYKVGRWVAGSLAGETAVSIVIADDGTIYVGDANGNVQQSTNDAASFDTIGAGAQLGAGNNVYVALDPNYATNGIIYAGSADGVFRWEVGTSPTWTQLDTGEVTTVTTTVGADAFTVAVDAATQVFTIQQTSGGVNVAATTGTPTIAFAAGTWTVTATGATDVVTVTAITEGTSGIIAETSGTGSALTLTKTVDADSDATVPATIAASGAASFILPDTAGTTTTTTGALVATAVVPSADGSLYVANQSANSGVRRSVSPTAIVPLLGFESVIEDLTSGAQLVDLEVVSGSNTLYALASNVAAGAFGYPFRVLTFEDILPVSPELVGPKDGTATPGTSVDLSWKAIDSPVTLTYTYQIATDARFANKVADATTIGTGVTVEGLDPGTKYWWRVYVSSPMLSKKSAYWTFTPKLGATGTTSLTTAPAPGATNVSLRPTFQWASVPGATSYELELADNPFFANASVKKPLTHTTWTWDVDLEYETTYYWRVRAVKSGKGILTNYSSWSEASFTTMAEPPPPAPPPAPPQITVQPAPPAPPPVVQVPPAPPSPVTPAVIWAIIIIGAVLVIAVIVLIVRTRRVP